MIPLRPIRTTQLLRYILSGLAGATVNMGTLVVLVQGGMWYLFATSIAFAVTLIVGFILQKFWTFGERATQTIPLQVGLFIILASLNFLVNGLSMYVLVERVYLPYALAQVLTIALIALYGFFVYKYLIFRSPTV